MQNTTAATGGAQMVLPAHAALYLALAITAWPAPAPAAPLALSTAPARAGPRPPAPNVIVTLDDSDRMAGAGITSLKAALNHAFRPENLPDGVIRLGWNGLNRCRSMAGADGQGCDGRNRLRRLDARHRGDFLDWVETGLVADGDALMHAAHVAAGEHYRTPATNIDGPWASEPGVRLAPVLACRRSYSILVSGGAWNHRSPSTTSTTSAGNADGTATVLGDGATAYDPGSDHTRIYRDRWGTAGRSTLADLAFHYWAADLQPSLPNDVPPSIRTRGSRSYESAGVATTIAEFWNPNNDPASWQHMRTYTIGFGAAAGWHARNAPALPSPQSAASVVRNGGYPAFDGRPRWGGDAGSGDFAALLVGTAAWPDPAVELDGRVAPDGYFDHVRRTELWHAAINGRGRFVPARTAAELSAAFAEILGDIVDEPGAQGPQQSGLAASAQTTRADAMRFAAGYDAASWRGQVEAHRISAGSGAAATEATWNSAELLDDAAFSPASRNVISSRTEQRAGLPTTVAIEWRWSALSELQKAQLGAPEGKADAHGEDRLNFLRGDRSLEGRMFRERGSRHGDIVNSRIWFTPARPAGGYRSDGYAGFRSARAQRPAMVYVGANDGMLHGFDADSGQERVAYVPEGLHPRLWMLTRRNYRHQYFVDGSPFTGDLYDTVDGRGEGAGGSWKTYLAGFPGAGGKGYFVLDVTDPASFGTGSVVLDRTATSDPDIGHIMGTPAVDASHPSNAQQITRLNNGRWALVMGNGYNSTDEKAVLLIQYLDGARELVKLAADERAGGGNGLATPRLVDLDGDRRADVAYAGDLHGRLWKFELGSTVAGGWTVAFAGAPLFAATDGSAMAQRQPITTAPLWQAHPDGGAVVVFATGRLLTDADRSSVAMQSVYGIRDQKGAGAVAGGRTALQAQTFADSSSGNGNGSATAMAGAAARWTVSTHEVGAAQRGWYIDLSLHAGERVLENPARFGGNLIDIPTYVPADAGGAAESESCGSAAAAAQSFLLTINAVSGHAPKSPLYGASDGGAGGNDAAGANLTGAGAPGAGGNDGGAPSYVPSGPRLGMKDGDGNEVCIAPPGQGRCEGRRGIGHTHLRPSWRQLQ